jgi:mannose-1-phosphate guanylyltransferase
VDDPTRFGCVPTDETGRVTAFLEKTPHPVTNRINAGCYVFTRSVIDSIPRDEVVSVERETFPGLIDAGELVLGYADRTYWLDVGTPAAFVKGSRDLVLGLLDSPALPGPPGESLLLEGARVSPEAKVRGGTTVGARAVVEAGASVVGSILCDDSVVEAGAVVTDSVVGKGARVCADTVVCDAVIGDGARVGPGNELQAGVRIWPGIELPERALRYSSDV